MVNRVALVFKGIKRTILLSDCIHSFIDFAGIAKRRSWGGEKRKLAMDSANESMYEDRRNKIPPSFRTNFPLEEEEGGDRLSHSLGISFPKSSLLCRDPRVALFYKEEKKGKKRTRRTSFKNLLKDQRLIYLSLLFGNIFSLNRVLSEGYIYSESRSNEGRSG